MNFKLWIMSSILLSALCASELFAQDTFNPRWIALGEVAYARTWDDEGLLGKGAGLSVGLGYRLTSRLHVQALIQRIPYNRDIEYLTFDGRVLFTGLEAAFQSSKPKVRPMATIGAGVFNDDGVWIQKTIVNPSLPRVTTSSPRNYNLAAMTASGGVDFWLNERASIRTTVRFHGLLDTGDDAAPHIIIQPGIGVAWRW
jgi:hypothetical protein